MRRWRSCARPSAWNDAVRHSMPNIQRRTPNIQRLTFYAQLGRKSRVCWGYACEPVISMHLGQRACARRTAPASGRSYVFEAFRIPIHRYSVSLARLAGPLSYERERVEETQRMSQQMIDVGSWALNVGCSDARPRRRLINHLSHWLRNKRAAHGPDCAVERRVGCGTDL
jgi:hypothetical protein